MTRKINGGLKIGSEHEIFIEKMAHEGQGIGKINSMTVFVENAIIGEKCLIKIVKSKKDYAIAKIIKILEPSAYRVEPLCTSTKQCGGCNLSHMSYKGQLMFKTEKVKDSLRRIGHIATSVYNTLGMKTPWQYRNKTQHPVGMHGNYIVIGFYEKGTHNIVETKDCLLQHPIVNEVLSTVKTWMVQYDIPAYDEIAHRGLVRHVVTRVGYRTGEVMVIVVANGRELPFASSLIDKLANNIPPLKSVVLNVNTKKTNVILGSENIPLYGRPYIYDYIGDIKYRISPLSFFQVNPIQVKTLYDKALEYAQLTGSETVIDLYCGIGTITLFLAKRAKKVYGIEVVPEAISDAIYNAKMNGIDNVEFIQGAAETIMPELAAKGIKPDVIVVDPPRRGCDEKTLAAMVKVLPDRIVYVSCNPATLARDLRYLEDRGYKTEKVQPVDMFPQTAHVECVTLMSR
ncbi:MAG: 23S rRNA (uracil(1939)-C(5))-methyltransferase RlmD, partial [Thermoanaerobacteraceae bacterium]|nr:23S rRNA (uracil(1939)-C(5))-methyltransferase RlmD [Thermoanaerobacteraceae bacterium]